MSKRGFIIGILCTALLAVLFIASSTDLIIKERQTRVYRLSVIVPDASDEYYANFRKGVDFAADELNVDYSFVTLYESGSKAQQKLMIEREQLDGAEALVVVPTGEEEAADISTDGSVAVPLILAYSHHGTYIDFDFETLGRELADIVADDNVYAGDAPPIYLYSSTPEDESSGRFADGILSGLSERGMTASRIKGDEETLSGLLAENAGAVVIAINEESLKTVISIKEDEEPGNGIGAVYGRGSSVSTLYELQRGTVSALAVTDDFSAGYLAVSLAVSLIDGDKAESPSDLRAYVIRGEDMYLPEYEKLLYPIE